MKISYRIKAIMKEKKVTAEELAQRCNKSKQAIYNSFYRDRTTRQNGMSFANAEELAEGLGCEIVIRDKETGKEY